jgi:glycosyltransferase involved in cell wall biosynthesis
MQAMRTALSSMTVDTRADAPLVSIIMPVRNEAKSIEKSLQSVLSQSYSGERTEILIVDGMSDDETRNIIDRMTRQPVQTMFVDPSSEQRLANPPPEIRIIDNPARVVPSALNIGLAHARGDIIFRLDGHSELMSNYIDACVSKLQEHRDVACVAGPSVAVGTGVVGQTYALALRSPIGVGGRTFRTLKEESFVDTLAFGAYRKEVFAELGGFDPELWRNQDIEFSSRMRKAGLRMLLIQTTRTLYHAPESFGAVFNQCFKNGYWNTRVLNKMLGVLSWRHFVPGLFVATLIGLALASFLLAPASLALVILAVVYLLAIVCSGVATGWASGVKFAALLPLVIGSMHISYGLGSLYGAFEFASRSLKRWVWRSTRS